MFPLCREILLELHPIWCEESLLNELLVLCISKTSVSIAGLHFKENLRSAETSELPYQPLVNNTSSTYIH